MRRFVLDFDILFILRDFMKQKEIDEMRGIIANRVRTLSLSTAKTVNCTEMKYTSPILFTKICQTNIVNIAQKVAHPHGTSIELNL